MSRKQRGAKSHDPDRVIRDMGWNEFEAQLSRSARRGTSRAVSDQTLRDHFGSEKLERLQQLADRVRSARQKREPLRGNIIFIPGIMGSELTVTEDGDDDVVWISFLKLIWGGINKLRLDKDGEQEADSTLRVQPSGLDKDSYAEAILWLKAHWNVEPFAYDWRKDLDRAAKELKGLVETKFKDQPVHLVAHSMGGLVSRNFIRLYPKVWKAMSEPKKAQGGRLIMLGTPNYGSYAIAQAMVAKDKLVKWLADWQDGGAGDGTGGCPCSAVGGIGACPRRSRASGGRADPPDCRRDGSRPKHSRRAPSGRKLTQASHHDAGPSVIPGGDGFGASDGM